MASFIMAGRWQAIIFTSAFALLSLLMPPFAFFSAAAVALVTLRKGMQQGIIIALAASLILTLASVVILQGDALMGFVSGLQQWLPMVLIAALLNRTVSWTATLQIILLIAMGGLLLFHLSVSDPAQFWKEPLEQLSKAFLSQQTDKTNEIKAMIDLVATWATALLALGLLITWIGSLFIARYWQSILYHPGGFGEEFRELRMGKLPTIFVLIIVAIYAFTENQMLGDMAVVAMLFFCLHGLGLMHGLVKKMQMHTAWLVALYVLIMPIFPSSMIMLILLVSFGMIDSFADFRNTLAAKKD